jgi:hypothetical protein
VKSCKYTVDRFEGKLAILLLRGDESIEINVNRNNLPVEVKEGDILELAVLEDGSVSNPKILAEETKDARKKAENLLKRILDKNN